MGGVESLALKARMHTQLRHYAGTIRRSIHARIRTLGPTRGQGAWGQGSDKDLGVLLLCKATSALQNQRTTAGG